MASVRFEPFDVHDLDDISIRWTKWLSKLTRYFTFKEVTVSAKKINELFLFGGYDLEQVYNQHAVADEDYTIVIEKLTSHFNPTTNVQLNRYNFNNLYQLEDETFDDFVSRIRVQASICNFAANHDTACHSQIIQRCKSDSLKSDALSATLTLAQLLALGKLKESVEHQIKQLRNNSTEPPAYVNNIDDNKYERSDHQHSDHQHSDHQYKRSDYQHKNSDHQYKRSDHKHKPTEQSKCGNCGYDWPQGNIQI
jgi:hypothetical protein